MKNELKPEGTYWTPARVGGFCACVAAFAFACVVLPASELLLIVPLGLLFGAVWHFVEKGRANNEPPETYIASRDEKRQPTAEWEKSELP